MPSAVAFDNSGELYTVTTSGGSWSAVLWVKLATATSCGPFAYGSADAAGQAVFVTGNGTLGVGDLGSTAGLGSFSAATDTWYAIGLTVTSGGAGVFYHGTDPGSLTSASASGVQNPGGTQTFFIGSNSFTSGWWRGSLAAVKIWTGVTLTSGEVAAELGQYEPIVTSGLFGYYPFDAGPSTTDESGNGHTLTGGTGAAAGVDGPPIPLSGGVEGVLAGTTGAPAGALTGAVIDAGALAGTTGAPSGALAASVFLPGALAGTTGAPSGSLTDHMASSIDYPLHAGTVTDNVTRRAAGTATDNVARYAAGTVPRPNWPDFYLPTYPNDY